jgi:hypothetical protein
MRDVEQAFAAAVANARGNARIAASADHACSDSELNGDRRFAGTVVRRHAHKIAAEQAASRKKENSYRDPDRRTTESCA